MRLKNVIRVCPLTKFKYKGEEAQGFCDDNSRELDIQRARGSQKLSKIRDIFHEKMIFKIFAKYFRTGLCLLLTIKVLLMSQRYRFHGELWCLKNSFLLCKLYFMIIKPAISNSIFTFATIVANKYDHSPHF